MIPLNLILFSGSLFYSSVVGDTGAKPLVPFVYNDIPLGSITPNGWLRNELQTEADGLAGHLYDFWNYVHHSSWLGGDQEYSGLNEAFPYWLNGLVPLAYVLDDARLKDQVHTAMDYVMNHMIDDDGWIGPEANGPGGGYRMIWARSLVFFAWTNLADANKTWEQPIVDAMHNFNNLQVNMLNNNCTGEQPQAANTDLDPGYYFWGRGRVQEMIYSLQWLYDKHPQDNQAKLLEGMNLLHECGWNWEDWFVKGVYPTGDVRDYPDVPYQYVHGVNVGEGLKAAAVIRRYTYNDSLIQTAKDGSDWTFQYHGSAYGSIIADEGEVGLDPWSGSETCTAVEIIFSQAYNYRALGDGTYADSAEMAAFNALPGAMTGDWWAHVYMSEANQPFSKNLSVTPFSNVNTVGQTFGLEPNYPCCTVNHPQGLPKFLQSTFVTVGDNGILHALLSPATVQTSLSNGAIVTVECQTNYPFEEVLFYDITTDKEIEFFVRVPEWATSATLESASSSTSQVSNGLLKSTLQSGKTRLMYTLGAEIRTEPRKSDTIAVYRGQLLYVLKIDADVTSTGPHNYYTQELYPEGYAPPQSRDYTMINETEWAVAIDPTTLKFIQSNPVDYTLGSTPNTLSSPIFAAGAPPTSMTAQACMIDWPLLAPGTVPAAPPVGADRKCLGQTFNVTLVPFGSAKVRMTELPTLSLPSGTNSTTLCASQPSGISHVTSPDTPEAFVQDAYYAQNAMNATAPAAYKPVFINKSATPNAPQYIGYKSVPSYDVASCANHCDQTAGCKSFNIFYERDPSVTPNSPNCSNPPSVTNIKCALWRSVITAEENINSGQLRNKFHVVIAGSNGYTKQS